MHEAVSAPNRPGPSIPMGYLRAAVTLLVVAHHSVLAYHPDAPAAPKVLDGVNRWWGAFPVVDAAKWQGFSLFTAANDMYFMSLMFLLSGLFVWPSLQRKGAAAYLRARALRLGGAFLFCAGVVAPLAYFPAYLQSGATQGFAEFLRVFTEPGVWASGPAWFLWVLLALDAVVAALATAWPGLGDALARAVSRLDSPVRWFGALTLVASAAHLALEFPFGGFSWWHWGPFYVQSSRVLLYFTYFLFGVSIGALGLERSVLAAEGPLARQWRRWANLAPVGFVGALVLVILAFRIQPLPAWLHVLIVIGYTTGGVLLCMGALALALRFAQRPNPVFDALVPCAFGIYLVHYAVVSALQYLLLGVAWPGLAKGLLVTAGALAISWGLTAAFRAVGRPRRGALEPQVAPGARSLV